MLAFTLAAAAGSLAAAAKTIVVDKLAFGPAPRSLHVGDTVEWVNHDIFLHSASAADHSFDVELRPGATARVKLTHAGKVSYICRYHPGMKGQLVVQK